MSKKIGRTYTYLVAAFSLIILSYSIWILASTLKKSIDQVTETSNFYINMIIGVLGLVLALSSLSRLRGQIALMEKERKRVQTVVKCSKCDFKSIRDFEIGDFVNKDVGKCKQCGKQMNISSIYQEDIKT